MEGKFSPLTDSIPDRGKQGHLELAKGRKTPREQGHPNLAKNMETQKLNMLAKSLRWESLVVFLTS